MTTTHTNRITGRTQAGKILNVLRRLRGWVPMPLLASASGSLNVHSRISDLREAGIQIECRPRNKRRSSEYRIKRGKR